MTDELPPGWAWARVDELCEVTLGQSPPSSSYNDTGQGSPFLQGKAEFGATYPSIRKWTTQPKKHAAAGSVLVSVRAPVGPTNLAPVDCSIGRGLAALMPREPIAPEFMLWAMRASENRLAEQASGSTFDAITGAQLREHRVPVPPLPEQERIVTAIEEHFSRLDAIEAGLASAAQRAAWLFDCVVDEQLRSTDTSSQSLGDLLTGRLVNGRSVPTAVGSGHPVLRLTAIKDGLIDPGECKLGDFGSVDPNRFAISAGDFLVSRGNGSLKLVGRGGLVQAGSPPVAFPDTMIRVRLDESKLNPRFLSLVWNGRAVRRQLESQARTTAGIYKINQSMINAVQLQVPPLAVQHRLIQAADHVRHTTTVCTESLCRSRTRTAALHRSILSKAFLGQLLPHSQAVESMPPYPGLSGPPSGTWAGCARQACSLRGTSPSEEI